MATCRYCDEYLPRTSAGTIKYSTRHYAHDSCFLERRGMAGLDQLSFYNLQKFRLKTLRDLGLVDEFEVYYKDRAFKAALSHAKDRLAIFECGIDDAITSGINMAALFGADATEFKQRARIQLNTDNRPQQQEQ